MKLDVWTDGSYKTVKTDKGSKGIFSCGVVIYCEGMKDPLQFKTASDDSKQARLRNVAGELLAVICAMQIIDKLHGYDTVTIHHDYEGVAKWVTGEWKCKQEVTMAYKMFMEDYTSKYNISFEWVRGHEGVEGNELADKLAKEAIKEYVKNLC